MPEGDTVYKVSQVLSRELQGEALTKVFLRNIPTGSGLAGRIVEKVEPLGKHTLFWLEGDLLLRVHLGLTGAWHSYPQGAPWERPRGTALVVLETLSSVFACFQARDVELIPSTFWSRHRIPKTIGPDLLAPEEPCWESLLERVRRLHRADALLGEILLDQRVAAGIGNVYKSELAFMGPLENDPFECATVGYSPWSRLSDLEGTTVLGFFRRARPLLFANLGGWTRTTTVDRRVAPEPRGGPLYVYGRTGRACWRCRSGIKVDQQGDQARITYWCPKCQDLQSGR